MSCVMHTLAARVLDAPGRYPRWMGAHPCCLSLLLALFAALPRSTRGQDTAAVPIPAVTVTVTREAGRSMLEIPYALTRLGLGYDRRRSSLADILWSVPGVQVWHRFNPAQDPRIGVRGFGARAAFGIRGVRILRNGIPLTLADGQTAVDFLDVETLGSVEVLRGSAGALYGNASGGVLDFRTQSSSRPGWHPELSTWYSNSSWRGSASLGVLGANTFGRLTSTFNEGSGPRQYSVYRNGSASLDLAWENERQGLTAQLLGYRAPRAQNPGALTAVELARNPLLADSQNIAKQAGKTASQTLLAVQASHRFDGAQLSASLHAGRRLLDNPQPFAIVVFDRVMGGASVRGQLGRPGEGLLLSAGGDYLFQEDDRRNYANCAGLLGPLPPSPTCPGDRTRGALTLDQEEWVASVGAFVRAEVVAHAHLSLTGTLRSDRTRFVVLDRRNPSASRELRTMGALSPMAGINWKATERLAAYANVASSFETPTTTELANRPDGSGGLNRELQPQRGMSYETGMKLAAGSLAMDAALFRIDTRGELVPFEIPGGGGRRFFRNSGRTRRYGAELGLRLEREALSVAASATWLRYRYVDYTVGGSTYAGKKVPGVAPFWLGVRAAWRSGSWTLVLDGQRVARTPADDANSNFAPGYTKLDAQFVLRFPSTGLEPMLGVENLLDRHYAANVVANASRGRYYEPGAPRTVYLGLRLAARP
jgi:iron complex outermembrane receptor protein